MAQRTCSVDGCDKPHGARGLCYPHYGAWHRQTFGRKYRWFVVECLGCGEQAEVSTPAGKYCSDLCQGYHRFGPQSCKWTPPKPPKIVESKPKTWRTARECRGCGGIFTPLFTPTMLDCSPRCQARVQRRTRRARVAGATGTWIWSDFMRVAQRFGYCCAYCGARGGQLDPDHVVPLSRGGYNSVANLLPACRACNCDKRDLLLNEWQVDRVRRGLAPRATIWGIEDRRYAHLTQALLVT